MKRLDLYEKLNRYNINRLRLSECIGYMLGAEDSEFSKVAKRISDLLYAESLIEKIIISEGISWPLNKVEIPF